MNRIVIYILLVSVQVFAGIGLEGDFADPPREAGVRCWWWWLNSNVTKAAITRDLEAMSDKGFSGAMIFDAGTELWWGPDREVPNGPQFGGEEWSELYLHALTEAKRLELEIGLSIQSGWNLGGPFVTLDDKAKQLTASEVEVAGPGQKEILLVVPKSNYDYYRDICVLAYPKRELEVESNRIRDLSAKSGARELGGSAPDCRFLLNDVEAVEGEQDCMLEDIVDLTDNLDDHGVLKWQVPEGNWVVLRIGYTPTQAHVATSSDNWKGHVLDYLSEDAFNRYWDRTVEPLLEKAGDMAGTVLTQLETDSWECGGMNWSEGFAEDFRVYNGYDIIKYLPVVAGKIVDSRDVSNAFLADLRKTIAHCVSENHYRTFAENAARYNLGIQPECSGPHAGPLDGITNYSHSDITMSEFWIPCPHRPKPHNRFYVKQAASAAHIYGKQYVGAESFTSLRKPHWGVELWHDMKPHADYEFCEGLNMVFFHTFTCSPKEMGVPGQEYFAGTHVNPQVTWWNYSDSFIDYLNRVQVLTQKGKFVADVLYYYGDHVPNIAVYKGFNQAGSLPGYDYDVTNEEVLLELRVVDGKLVVPGGVEYRVLVLPYHKVLSLAVLEKVESLLKQGATVIGLKPERMVSLVGGAESQQRFDILADVLWGVNPDEAGERVIGKGQLVWGKTSLQYLYGSGLPFDFEILGVGRHADFQFIHYTVGEADVYFVCNQTAEFQSVECAFRVTGSQPEIWDPISGEIRQAGSFRQEIGRTAVPLEFDPFGSVFVVFDEDIATNQQGESSSNFPAKHTLKDVSGPWQVSFEVNWGGPELLEFETLTDWTKNTDDGIKYYSGQAVYRNKFELDKEEGKRYWIQLNNVLDAGIAAVKINGTDVGITWTKPFSLEITDAVAAGENQLEVTVVNTWQNRLIGDRGKPQEERFTETNIKVKDEWKLRPSGLMGPVEIMIEN